jgi:hypothetical protein
MRAIRRLAWTRAYFRTAILMSLDRSWVLIRPPGRAVAALTATDVTGVNDDAITWHRLLIRCVDMKRQASLLYGVPTLCGLSTPTQLLDVLAYSTAAPRWASTVCVRCVEGISAEHQTIRGRLVAVA